MFPKNRKKFRISLELKKIVFRLSERYFLSHNREFNFKKSISRYKIIMIFTDLIVFHLWSTNQLHTQKNDLFKTNKILLERMNYFIHI